MSEQIENLRNVLRELQEELESIESLDDERFELLNAAVHDIDAALHEPDDEPFEEQTLIERLQEAADQFESAHPTLTGIVSRAIDALGQMGI